MQRSISSYMVDGQIPGFFCSFLLISIWLLKNALLHMHPALFQIYINTHLREAGESVALISFTYHLTKLVMKTALLPLTLDAT
jgi:hypothetical protein